MDVCGDIGAVPRHDVLSVLRNSGVSVAEDGDMVTLYMDEVLEAHRLPASIPRRLVHRFARLFGIPIHHFYHPSDPLNVN